MADGSESDDGADREGKLTTVMESDMIDAGTAGHDRLAPPVALRRQPSSARGSSLKKRPSVEVGDEELVQFKAKESKLKQMIDKIEKQTPQRTRSVHSAIIIHKHNKQILLIVVIISLVKSSGLWVGFGFRWLYLRGFMTIVPPHKSWLQYWTVGLAMSMIYQCTSIPLILAFGQPDMSSPLFAIIIVVNILSELPFIADIFLNFHIGFTDSSGAAVLQPHRIKERYIEGWFALDVLVTIPMDMGLTEVGQYLRVMKLMRFFPVMMRTASLEIHTSGLALFSRVSKLAFPLFLVFHIVACFWISFGTHGEFGQTVFVPSKAIGDMPSSVQYVISLFWALSVLSNTSIPEGSPTTNLEAIFCIISMTAGLGVISYVVGAIGALMEQKNVNRRIHEGRLYDIVKFMEFNEVPSDMQKRVISYMEYKWTATDGFEPEAMFESLPKSLNRSLSTALARDVVDQVSFFSLLHDQALNALVLKLKPQLCTPMEYVYKMGDAAKMIYFIRGGEMQAILHSSKYDFQRSDEQNNSLVYGVESLSTPDAFGIFESLVLKKCIMSLRASTFVELYSLSVDDLFEALAQFPDQLAIVTDHITFNMTKTRKMDMLEALHPKLDSTMANPVAGSVSTAGPRRSICVAAGIDPEKLSSTTVLTTLHANKAPASLMQQMAIMPATSKNRLSSKVIAAKKAKMRRSLSTQLAARRGSASMGGSTSSALPLGSHVKFVLKNFVILPTTRFAKIWSLTIAIVNIYNICMIPFRIVFIPDWLTPEYIAFDYFGDFLYLVDIYLNFHMAFMSHGRLLSQTIDISDDYIKTRLYRHIVASIPADILMLWTGPNAIWRIPRMLRALDVYQLLNVSSLVGTQPWLTLTKKVGALLLQFLYISHITACCYFVFANVDGYGVPDNKWLPPAFLDDDEEPLRKYLYGLYFSYDMLLRLGVGIVPRSSWQVIFSIVVLLNGVLVVAQLIGSFSSFLQVYDHGESAFKDRMHQLEQYLLKTRVPKKIRTRVIDYYRFVWNDLSGVDVNNVLRVLPDRLREDVMFSLCGSVLDRVNEIKKAPKGLRIRLSSFLIFEAYSEGSIIFETGDFAEHIYFLRRGRVDITVEAVNKSGARQSTLYDVVLPGRYFGELSVFGDERQRIMTATSKENTHLIKLSRGDFLTVLDQFPEFKQQFIDTGSTNKK